MLSDGLPAEYDLWFRAVRRQYLLRLLTAAKGNQCEAARLSGVHRNTIWRMIQEDGLTESDLRNCRVTQSIPRTETKECPVNR